MRSRSENVILQFVKLTLINSSHYQPQVKIEQVVQCRVLYHIGDSELLQHRQPPANFYNYIIIDNSIEPIFLFRSRKSPR